MIHMQTVPRVAATSSSHVISRQSRGGNGNDNLNGKSNCSIYVRSLPHAAVAAIYIDIEIEPGGSTHAHLFTRVLICRLQGAAARSLPQVTASRFSTKISCHRNPARIFVIPASTSSSHTSIMIPPDPATAHHFWGPVTATIDWSVARASDFILAVLFVSAVCCCYPSGVFALHPLRHLCL